jgi:hypothetical protein
MKFRKPIKHDKTLLDWIADALEKDGMRIGKIDREKGTLNVLSVSTRAVHKITLTRV